MDHERVRGSLEEVMTCRQRRPHADCITLFIVVLVVDLIPLKKVQVAKYFIREVGHDDVKINKRFPYLEQINLSQFPH